MNKSSIKARQILRIVALAMSIALIFGSIAVFNAEGTIGDPVATSSGDASDTDVSDTDVSDTDVSDADVSDTDVSDTDVSDTDVSDTDVSDTDVSDTDVSDTDVSGSDTSGSDTSGSDTSGSDTSGSDTSGSDAVCDFCGETSCGTRCHAHDAQACRKCETCGKCTCAVEGKKCYSAPITRDASAPALCESCTCLRLIIEDGGLGNVISLEDVTKLTKGEIASMDVEVGNDIYVYVNGTLKTLAKACADGDVKITEFTAMGTPVKSGALPINCLPFYDSVNGYGTYFRLFPDHVLGGKDGDIIPVEGKITIQKGSETKTDDYVWNVHIEDKNAPAEDEKDDVPENVKVSADFKNKTISKGEAAVIEAEGWFDGATLGASETCYLPVSWKLDSKHYGSWQLPANRTDDNFKKVLNNSTDEEALKDLEEGTYNAKVTFQEFVRNAAGQWVLGDQTATVNAKLTVEKKSTGTSGSDADDEGGNSNSLKTGDIITRDYTGRNIAGTIMLIAGLMIGFAVVGERVYRLMQEKKRHAGVVRR